MLVSLIGKERLLSTVLPEIPEGVYWIKGSNDKKLLNIESRVNEWYISSSKAAKIINFQAVVFKNDKMMLIPNRDFSL